MVGVVDGVEPSVTFLRKLTAEGLLGGEDCAEESEAFDGLVLVDDEKKGNGASGYVVAVDGVLMEGERWAFRCR